MKNRSFPDKVCNQQITSKAGATLGDGRKSSRKFCFLTEKWALPIDKICFFHHCTYPLASVRREVISIAHVEVNSEEPLEKALKRFKREVEKEGIIREWKKREFFEKPSVIRNRKKKALRRKQEKKIRKSGSSKKY